MRKEAQLQSPGSKNNYADRYSPHRGRRLGIGRRLLLAAGVVVAAATSTLVPPPAEASGNGWPQYLRVRTSGGQIVNLRFTNSSPQGAFICSGPRAKILPNADGTFSFVVPIVSGASPRLAAACSNAHAQGMVEGPYLAEVGEYAAPSAPGTQHG